jgi:hypothetical protein
MELVQPMLDKADVDHGITSRLDNEFESIRQRLETLTFETTKTLKKAVTQNEFQLRVSEIVTIHALQQAIGKINRAQHGEPVDGFQACEHQLRCGQGQGEPVSVGYPRIRK